MPQLGVVVSCSGPNALMRSLKRAFDPENLPELSDASVGENEYSERLEVLVEEVEVAEGSTPLKKGDILVWAGAGSELSRNRRKAKDVR